MKLARFVKNEWLQILILAMPFIIILFVWNLIPDRVPIHWDYHGHANNYGSKGVGLFLLPIINVGLAVLIGLLPKIDPKGQMTASLALLRPIRLIITGFLFLAFCVMVLVLLGVNVNVGTVFQLGLPLLFLLLGYYLPRVKPNYFIGVRTPWALESPENWQRTHQFTSRLWVVVSLLYILLEVIYMGDVPEGIFLIYFVVLIIPPFVYSWMIFQRSKQRLS